MCIRDSYTAVAEWMGVSKWTAYDMLRRLEQKGYLESYCDVSVKGLSLIHI